MRGLAVLICDSDLNKISVATNERQCTLCSITIYATTQTESTLLKTANAECQEVNIFYLCDKCVDREGPLRCMHALRPQTDRISTLVEKAFGNKMTSERAIRRIWGLLQVVRSNGEDGILQTARLFNTPGGQWSKHKVCQDAGTGSSKS